MANQDVDHSWAGFAELAEEQRAVEMERRFREVLGLPEDERHQHLRGMILAEYALDPDSLHSFTRSRLRTWVSIAKQDLGEAQAVARGYDRVFDELPADMAMRRASIVQTVARQDLTGEEIEHLYEVIPSLVRHVPRAPTALDNSPALAKRSAAAAAASAAASGGGPAVAAPSKPWWRFW